MELLPTPDTGGATPPAPEPGLVERLAAVELRLAALTERLARVESALGPTVAQEVRGATSELARAITELGRRLALDLPHELRRHRDAIVSELRPPPPPPPPPPPAPGAGTDAAPVDAGPPDDTGGIDGDDHDIDGTDGTVDSQADRRRMPRRRRRPV